MQTNYRLLVFLTALATLMFELVVSRLADFHLGSGNAYLAIPITFLGLALGSLHVHARRRIVERFDPFVAVAVLAVLCFLSVLAVFVVFSKLLPVVSELQVTQNRPYLLYKTLAFIGVLLPPFYYFGRILTVSYQIKREEIGAVYSADFWGAALACAITPLLFHFGGLPNVTLVLLALVFAPVLVFFRGRVLHRLLIGLVLVAACFAGQRIIAAMDDSLDYGRYFEGITMTELTHEWNEHSRVALLYRKKVDSTVGGYRIVHDNSRSNVNIEPYMPQRVGREVVHLDAKDVIALLDRDVTEALVVFAGCGKEMVILNEVLGGTARITGVELNPLVRDLALGAEELSSYRLQEFHDLPHINLVIDEGRHFLSTTPVKYDLILVGTNAATGVLLTGHSRKYLDTVEAFHLFLDNLADGGVLIFDHQPLGKRIETMKQVFVERGIPDFEQHVVILKSHQSNDMLVSPSGFTDAEIRGLLSAARRGSKKVRYAPRVASSEKRMRETVEAPVEAGQVMTDDRPFLYGLYWDRYRPIPREDQVIRRDEYQSWIKISTLLILVVISLAFIAVSASRRSSDLPPSVLFYLLLTGFCFMLVEIAMIAKLELFLQKPIVSMAAVLSTFLLTSGIGSWLFPRIEKRIRLVPFALVVAALVVVSIFVLDFLGTRLLGLPIPARLPIAFLVMTPVGVSLGLFFPYAVSCLVRNDRPGAVAITYGMSTLSGVIGATYAMTIMLNSGFSSLLWQAGAGYLLLALFAGLYSGVFGGRFLTLPARS